MHVWAFFTSWSLLLSAPVQTTGNALVDEFNRSIEQAVAAAEQDFDFAAADERLRAAIALTERFGNPVVAEKGAVKAQLYRAELLEKLGKLAAAETLLAAAALRTQNQALRQQAEAQLARVRQRLAAGDTKPSVNPKRGRASKRIQQAAEANGKQMGQMLGAAAYEQAREGVALAVELGDESLELAGRLEEGAALASFGNYGLATVAFERAVVLGKKLGESTSLANAWLGLGRCQAAATRYAEALASFEQSRAALPEAVRSSGRPAAILALQFGRLYAELGDDARAIAALDDGLKAARAGGHSELVAPLLNELGVIYKNQERYDEALAAFDEAQKGQDFRSMRGLLQDAVDTYVEAGRYDAAMAAMKYYQDLRAGGKMLLIDKEWAMAIDYWRRYLAEASALGDEQVFVAHTGLGRALLGAGILDEAREQFQKAIDLVEVQRGALQDGQRQSFFSRKVWGYRRTMPYEGLCETELAAKRPDAAFMASELVKGRAMAEALAGALAAPGEVTLPAALAQEERAVRDALRVAAQAYDNAYRRNDRLQLEPTKQALDQVRKRQAAFVAKLRVAAPEYAAVHFPQALSPRDVALGKGEALAVFEVSATHVHLFLLRDKKLSVRSTEIARSELGARVRELRAAFEGIDSADKLLRFSPEKAKALYDLLFGDALAKLAASDALIIVPDEVLGVLPFEALVTALPAAAKLGSGAHGPFPLGVKYLGDDRRVSYAPSATALSIARLLKKKAQPTQAMFIAADPVFSARDPRASGKPLSAQSGALQSAVGNWRTMGVAGSVDKATARTTARAAAEAGPEVFVRLDKTTSLAQALGAQFPGNAQLLLGLDASEARVKAAPLGQFRYLTFATHGILDNALPLVREPALVLSLVGNAAGDDGFLTTSEVGRLRLNADLVALTACETGVGQQVSGEGVMGMGRAFQLAGASNVMMSLWSVAEESSTALTAGTFAALSEGRDVATALMHARQAIRKKGFEHPFYWAAFIAVGK